MLLNRMRTRRAFQVIVICFSFILGSHLVFAAKLNLPKLKIQVQGSSPAAEAPGSVSLDSANPGSANSASAKKSRKKSPPSPRQKGDHIKFSIKPSEQDSREVFSKKLIKDTKNGTRYRKPKVTHDLQQGLLADPKHLKDNFESSP